MASLTRVGNLLITGIFRRIVEFGPTSLTNATAANNIYDEVFVAKFSPTGIPLWAQRGGGEGNDQGLGIGVDGAGNAIVTGLCDNTTALNGGTSVQFDIGGFVFPSAIGGGLGNMFIAKFAANGDGVWARKLGGASYGAALLLGLLAVITRRGELRQQPLALLVLALSAGWCNVAFILAVLEGLNRPRFTGPYPQIAPAIFWPEWPNRERNLKGATTSRVSEFG